MIRPTAIFAAYRTTQPRALRFCVHAFGAFLLLAVSLAASAHAQQVSGTVRITGVTAALGEASIVLIDTSGTVVGGTLSSENGSFALRAPRAGTYRIRARRIGFLPDSSAFVMLSAGRTQRIELALRPFPTQLAKISVKEAQRCVIAPEAGAAAFRLWQEAQSALTATAVTSHDDRLAFALHRFENELEPGTGRVTESRSWDSRTTTSEPYASIPAESLAVHGFVVPDGKMLVYYAPDARTLTSDAFARTHCFHPTENAAHPDLVGLAFAPTARRARDESIREVSGTLWFDQATLALRTLEFEYRGASDNHAPSGSIATGKVQYERLPTGAWIVSHWIIRMPVVTISTAVDLPGGLADQAGGITVMRRRVEEVSALWEAGGDVEKALLASASDSLNSLSAYGVVRGTVMDSTPAGARKGIGDVLVALRADGTDHAATISLSARTDSTGAFIIDSVPPGDYSLDMTSAKLDTLGVRIASRTMHVEPAMQHSLLAVVPDAAVAARRLCPASSSTPEKVVRGFVTDSSGTPASNVRVVASWFNIADMRRERFSAATQNAATFSDDRGEYLICDLPPAHAIVVTAIDGAIRSPAVNLEDRAAVIQMANIVLPRARQHAEKSSMLDTASSTAAKSSRIDGTVLDSVGQAVAAASVRLDSAAWVPVAQHGRFRVDHVTPGRHLLEVRALGYGPHAWYVNVPIQRAAIANLVLQRVTTLQGVTVLGTADTARLDMTGFMQRRRNNPGGYYLGPAEFAKRNPQRLTDVLKSLPGVELHPVTNYELGTIDYVLVMRGVATGQGEVCPIQYYLDGSPFPTPDNIDRLVSPNEVYAIEVYSGASQVPPQFNGPTARCGVIVIWTRSSQQ